MGRVIGPSGENQSSPSLEFNQTNIYGRDKPQIRHFRHSVMAPATARVPNAQDDDLDKLYPRNLELRQVHIFFRHGERTPIKAFLQNTGLSPHWPYCHAAKRMRSVGYNPSREGNWDAYTWQRKLETFGEIDDRPTLVRSSSGAVDGLCQPGELTQQGRETTFALGTQLRHLYVSQLGFMPETIANTSNLYLRSTWVERALESVQQVFLGMYPLHQRAPDFPPHTVVLRALADEILFPNEFTCQRFKQLRQAFTRSASARWDGSEEMQYLTNKIGQYMPAKKDASSSEERRPVTVEGAPGITDIMDMIHTTAAHGPETKLPNAFYDPQLLKIAERASHDEYFRGYSVNREYRKLGMGALVGDLVARMVSKAETPTTTTPTSAHPPPNQLESATQPPLDFALYGCHDTTLGGFLASYGAPPDLPRPGYTNHIAIELFRETSTASPSSSDSPDAKPIGRRPWRDLSDPEKRKLDRHYVRMRYNQHVVKLPGCAAPGRHLEGDEGFCTLEAFKRIADAFTPRDWKAECVRNLGAESGDGGDGVGGRGVAGVAPGVEEQPAGLIEESW